MIDSLSDSLSHSSLSSENTSHILLLVLNPSEATNQAIGDYVVDILENLFLIQFVQLVPVNHFVQLVLNVF